MRKAVAALLALGLVAGVLGIAVVGSATIMLGNDDGSSPSAAAVSAVSATMLALYQQAATTCARLPWTILAAIGTVESDNGQSDLPGVHSGANAAGAEGPMQFLPATFLLGNTTRIALTWPIAIRMGGPEGWTSEPHDAI